MRVIIVAGMLLAGSLAGPSAYAQVNEKFSDLADEIEMVRSMAQSDRKAVVSGAMAFTAEEAAAFWPLYDQYRAEMRSKNDKLVKLITDYAATYNTLTDDDGKKLVDEYLTYRSDALKLRTKYVSKFSKVLPGKKLARFYQIENKLDILSDLSIASNIPLAR